MSIRDQAKQMVSNYLSTASEHCADKQHQIDAIVNLAITTYNKGLARATDVSEVKNSGL